MLRRWIIRSFFIVPILLCLGAWGWSRSHWMRIGYCHHERFVSYYSARGIVDVRWGTSHGQPDEWWCHTWPADHPRFWPAYRGTTFPGFHYFYERTETHTSTLLEFPWWFLIIVFSAILYVVWRKTRPRGTGRAFPVELTAPRSEPDGKTQ